MNVPKLLFERGYTELVSVAPPGATISPGSELDPSDLGKRPAKSGSRGWYGYGWQTDEPTLDEVSGWTDRNIGLRGTRFPALDIDSENAELVALARDEAERRFGPAPEVGRENSTKTKLVFRTSEPFTRVAVEVRDPSGERHLIEWLPRGRQYLVHGTHPSGAAYTMDVPLWDIDPEELAEVTPESVDQYLEWLADQVSQKAGWSAKRLGKAQRGETPPQEDLLAPSEDALREVVAGIENDERFHDRDDWIKVGYAIRAAAGENDDLGLELFRDFCDRWEDGENDPGLVASEWRRMYPPFRVGFSYLCELAGAEQTAYLFDFDDPGDMEPTTVAPKTNDPLQQLNDEGYSVLWFKEDTYILYEAEDETMLEPGESPFKLLRLASFILRTKNRILRRPGKDDTQLSTAWLKWPKRREYKAFKFEPGKSLPSHIKNMWEGWPVEPKEGGSCKLFLRHLFEVICDENEDHYKWLLMWFAHLFQKATEKTGHAVAVIGGQGSGKSMVGKVFRKLLGRYHMEITHPDHITGRFNDHLEHTLLAQVEEAFWHGDKKGTSVLKALVTSDRMIYDRKSVPLYEARNYTRLFITSNSRFVWPADMDDRRLVIFEARDTYQSKKAEYFDPIFEELENGGYEALMHFLLTLEIDEEVLYAPPVTEALHQQASSALSGLNKWYFNILDEGVIPGVVHEEEDGTVTVETSTVELYQHYLSTLTEGERRYAETPEAMAALLGSTVARKGKRVRRVQGGFVRRGTTYHFGTLKEHREEFVSTRRAARSWDVEEEWIASELDFFNEEVK